MPYVPVPDTLQAELRFTWAGQQVENTLYFTGSAGVTPSLATDLGDALIGWWTGQFAPIMSNTLTLVEVFLTDLTTNTSFTVSDTSGLPVTGASTTDSEPNNVSLCVSFRTVQRGRSGRGRNYVPGLTEAQVNGNVVGATTISDITGAYSILLGAGSFVAGLQWVVVSRFHNGVERTTGLAIPITTVLVVDNIVDSQRRRLPGRGV